MRIALVAEDYYPQLGGVPEHVHNLALQLNRWGHTATVVTSYMGDYPDAEFVRRIGTSRVIYANGGVSRVTTGWRLVRRLEELFRAERCDIVHVHGGLAPTFGMAAPFAAGRAGIPVVATFHSWFPRSLACQVFRRPLQKILDRHAATIAVSQPVVDANARYFQADWEIIPNGVDTRFFEPNGRRPPALTEHPRLLFLGRIEPRNGLGTLLDAMPRILARYPGALLTVAGDGPWRGYYERRARGLGTSVRFVGKVFGDRPAYYSSADLYLCPTEIASFGVTLLEAMACGTPMIVADNVGYRSVVDGGAEALVVPKNDPAIWAEATIALLGDAGRRAAMGRAGLEKAARFAWPRIARAELAVYERVLGARAKGRSASAAASPASEFRYGRTPRNTSVIASTSR
jgi:phosphatidyl-myo-inositol alpha-mannosyltransferase